MILRGYEARSWLPQVDISTDCANCAHMLLLQATSLTARVAELEAEVDAARSEARSFGSMAASKERDAHRRLEGLQDELEHANGQVGRQAHACYRADVVGHASCRCDALAGVIIQ